MGSHIARYVCSLVSVSTSSSRLSQTAKGLMLSYYIEPGWGVVDVRLFGIVGAFGLLLYGILSLLERA